jgi:hypothetical protein
MLDDKVFVLLIKDEVLGHIIIHLVDIGVDLFKEVLFYLLFD